MQSCGMPPLFVTWAESLSTETVGEDGLNLIEDLFFLVFT